MVLAFFNKKFVLKLFCISVFLKIVILIVLGSKTFLDGMWYVNIAAEIYQNGFLFPNNEIRDAPGTPYFYAFFYPLTAFLGQDGYALGNILLASATIVLVYKISLEIFEKESIGKTAAIITAFYPYFNFYSITLLSEIVYIFFLYLSLFYAVRFIKRFHLFDLALFSFFFAIDTLIRFANLPMTIFFFLLFAFIMVKNKVKTSFIIKSLSFASLIYILAMSPWWIRNYQIHGHFVATSIGESGKVFYSGNNPMNKSGGGIGGVDVDLSIFEHIKDPKLKDEVMKEAGINWIKENPTDWLILELKKLKRLYSPVFYDKGYDKWYYNLISILSYGVIFILFLFSLYRYRSKFTLYSPMLLYAFLLTGVHLVFIASIRYRLPIEPFMIIMASPVILDIIKRYEKTS